MNCDTAINALTQHIGSFPAGVALKNCPKLQQVNQNLYTSRPTLPLTQSLDIGWPQKVSVTVVKMAPFSRGQFLKRDFGESRPPKLQEFEKYKSSIQEALHCNYFMEREKCFRS